MPSDCVEFLGIPFHLLEENVKDGWICGSVPEWTCGRSYIVSRNMHVEDEPHPTQTGNYTTLPGLHHGLFDHVAMAIRFKNSCLTS